MNFATINPATNEVIEQFDFATPQAVTQALEQGHAAFKQWRHSSFDTRAALLHKVAQVLEEEKEKHARLISLEMGKTLGQAVAEVKKCAMVCRYYADNASQQLADQPLDTPQGKAFVAHDPLGIILAVMPWNFPYWQVFRAAAPALMAGNTILLKHAPNVPQCALAIAKAFETTGFPEGVFTQLFMDVDTVAKVIDDDRIAAATVTGSERAGSAVAARAGKNIKKTVLELGGSDAFVVLEDANLDLALKNAVKSRMVNNGQSCIAAKRFIVHKAIASAFTQGLKERFEALKIGNPLQDEAVDQGPMAREDLAQTLDQQVSQTIQQGATLVLGGKRLPGPGAFYAPTILTNIQKGMPAYSQELFGPVASIYVVNNEEEAVALANDTMFGLGGTIWTQDTAKGLALARRIEAGAVYVNKMMASDPNVPFGGIKKSGYGRELSNLGIKEFTNTKTIWVG